MPDRHPFVRASLTLAIRALLAYRHRHETWQEMGQCPACMARFWRCLADAAPVKTMQRV